MAIPLYHVDAFADGPFTGNPAAVCLLDREREDSWLQSFAAEMNLSETAYLLPHTDGFALRWFAPIVEIALCGHATLASAHILWETGILATSEMARFHTMSGVLTATSSDDLIELDFPATPAESADPPSGLLEALDVSAVFVGKTRFDYLVELESAQQLRSLTPDFAKLQALRVRGVIVTSRSDTPEFDFISRFFAPGSGIDEDPATGSAHCALGPHWAARLGKNVLHAFQASRRTARIRVSVRGDRIGLAGSAVTISKGEICI